MVPFDALEAMLQDAADHFELARSRRRSSPEETR
jgi:hypothetical protein